MPVHSVILRNIRDGAGLRYLEATLSAAGDVTISGQDLGAGVEAVFGAGNREYEWAWTIRGAEVGRLRAALGCAAGDDVLVALHTQFADDAAAQILPFLAAHEIAYDVWSRIGE